MRLGPIWADVSSKNKKERTQARKEGWMEGGKRGINQTHIKKKLTSRRLSRKDKSITYWHKVRGIVHYRGTRSKTLRYVPYINSTVHAQ